MGKTSTSGLSREKLVSLLAIGSEPRDDRLEPEADRAMATLLARRLEEPLLAGGLVSDNAQGTIEEAHGDAQRLTERPLGELLLDPSSDLAVIAAIKDHAKRGSAGRQESPERAIAILIYYAAIASGLVFHNVLISSHSLDYLGSSLAEFASKGWVPKNLRELFSAASASCTLLKEG